MSYEEWIDEVRSALAEINMSPDDWQPRYPFDFRKSFDSGRTPLEAAKEANAYWWSTQPVPKSR